MEARAAFNQYPRRKLMGYSMRTDRYRFTVQVNRDDHEKVDTIELYDHQTDPQGNENIAILPKSAELVKTLSHRCRGLFARKPAPRTAYRGCGRAVRRSSRRRRPVSGVRRPWGSL
jgi:hypothetical protein